MARHSILLLFAACLLLAALVMSFAQGFLFLDPVGAFHDPDKSEDRLDLITPYLDLNVRAIDSASSMLLTLSLAFFVLVGFSAQKFRIAYLRPIHAVSLFIFIVASFLSLYLAYVSKVQAVELVNAVKLDFTIVEITVARQALLVSISAISALFLSGLLFLTHEGVGTAQDPAGDEGRPRTGSGDPNDRMQANDQSQPQDSAPRNDPRHGGAGCDHDGGNGRR